MKRLLLMLCLSVCTIGALMAQRTITGVITSGDGEALIGANVIVKGTTIGTVTDFDGRYELEVPDNTTTLVVSYTGFDSREIELGASNILDLTMSEGIYLEEAVVTALGIERNARDVSYANQTVESEDLLSSPNKNTLEALRGKVAGVKISQGSGSVGASTRIVLRGEGSLTGDNNALIVIDGIPIDNAATRSGDPNNALQNLAVDGYSDFGNRFNDLNPNDIESVTVLKGPSATSLYGSRGAAGVLLITTKTGGGADGKTEVGINSSFSVEEAYVLMQRQDQYGQGFGIPFQAIPGRDSGENWSWGPAFDGVVRPWTSPVDADGDGDLEYLSRPYSAVPNQIDNFFDLGHTLSNSIYFSGAKENFTYYASYSNTDQDGTLQNTGYNRNTFKLSASAKVSDKFSTNFSVSYGLIDQNTAQEGSRPFEGQNAYANALQAPVNIPYTELKDYNSPFHGFTGYYGSYTVNPYFVLNENVNEGKIRNFLGNMGMTYNLMDNWDVQAKFGFNNVQTDVRQAVPQYQYTDHLVWGDGIEPTPRGGRQGFGGEYSETDLNNSNIDITGLTNYSLSLTDDISADISLGMNFFDRKTERLFSTTVGGIVVPEFYDLSNAVSGTRAEDNETHYRIIGGFGNLRLGWQNKVFLEYSARNDWSSTLPVDNNSFFYQAVGASAVITDLLNVESDVLSFLKVRASYGTTGKDAGLYLLEPVFVANPTLQSLGNGHDLTFPVNGQAGFTQGNRIGNPDLKPELTTTFEAGIDASFLKDRINLEYTYYNSDHTNQIVIVTLPNTTGYTSTVANLGEMNNKGHEVALTLRPLVNSNGLNWDINLLYAKNENEVIKVNPEANQDELTVGSFSGVTTVAKVGLPYGTFKGLVRDVDAQGRTIVDASGLPTYTNQDYLGSYQPDYTASLGTTLGFKGLSANVLFDVRQGGKYLSYTKDLVEFNGTALTTLIGGREAFVVENSVTMNSAGELVENTSAVAPYDYVRNFQFSDHIIDASFVKLRELGLRYQVPSKTLDKLPFKSATIGVFAKNLKFWLADENTFADPEINGPALTGNASGIETTQTPPSKSYGVTLGLVF